MSNNKISKRVILIIFFIIICPFIYPIILNIMIKLNIFISIEHYLELINAFSNNYTLLAILIILLLGLLVLFTSFEKNPKFKEFLSGIMLKIKSGDKELSIETADTKKTSQEVFEKNPEIDYDESNYVKKLIKDELKNNNANPDEKYDEIKELNKTIRNIRFFSAYNNTNYITEMLLSELYSKKCIEKEKFEKELEKYYRKKIKHKEKNKKSECIKRKIEEKIFNYNFLDIIEISDDDKFIILTDIGEEFVKLYLIKKGDD